MKYKVIASDPLYGRMLALELERMGYTAVSEKASECDLLALEGQAQLPEIGCANAAVLIECGLLAAALPPAVKVLILDRPFRLAELRGFCSEREQVPRAGASGEPILINPDELSVSFGSISAKLTKREFALFEYLYKHPGETVTRTHLLRELWADENARDTNVVDVYIRFLRTKLDERFGIKLIRAKRGEGYAYSPDFNTIH